MDSNNEMIPRGGKYSLNFHENEEAKRYSLYKHILFHLLPICSEEQAAAYRALLECFYQCKITYTVV
jgi:hypothetical protein